MKYLYYSIYMFYKNVVKVGSYDTPHFYARSILSLLQMLFIWFSIEYIYIYLNDFKNVLNTTPMIPFLGYLLLLFGNKKYYKKRKIIIIKELGTKNRKYRNTIHIISAVIIIILIKIFFSMATYQRNLIEAIEKDYYEIPY